MNAYAHVSYERTTPTERVMYVHSAATFAAASGKTPSGVVCTSEHSQRVWCQRQLSSRLSSIYHHCNSRYPCPSCPTFVSDLDMCSRPPVQTAKHFAYSAMFRRWLQLAANGDIWAILDSCMKQSVHSRPDSHGSSVGKAGVLRPRQVWLIRYSNAENELPGSFTRI